MIGSLYAIAVADDQISAITTMIEVTAASTSVTLIERLSCTQSDTNASENCAVTLQRVTTTGTYTDSAFIPPPFQATSAAFGGTVKTKSTITPTYTASKILIESGFNILSGFLWTPASDDEIVVLGPSTLIGFELSTVGAGAITFCYGMTIREIGA